MTALAASPIGGTARRTLFAWYFAIRISCSASYITGESRILLHRNIQDRVRDDRAIPPARPRPLYRGQRRTAVLDAGRLHDERLVPLRPAAIPTAATQLHPQLGQGGHRRL